MPEWGTNRAIVRRLERARNICRDVTSYLQERTLSIALMFSLPI